MDGRFCTLCDTVTKTEKTKGRKMNKNGQKAHHSRADSQRNTSPYILVEGPEPSQDISYKWVYQLNEVQQLETGIPLHDYER